jgi:ubiquinone/menaquinone biosynthesis C-methylase UbiE
MSPQEAVDLLRDAVPSRPGTWADIGCGEGTFTRALVELLGRTSRIIAVDRDAKAIAEVERWAASDGAQVASAVADFSRPFDVPGVKDGTLDGILFANALHFVREPSPVLARLAVWLKPGGRAVIVEYDRRAPNPWVPHPIPARRIAAVVSQSGLSPAVITATRPSAFGGNLYVAVADKPDLSAKPL